jgi:DNA-binding transcriptional LysR family regulator
MPVFEGSLGSTYDSCVINVSRLRIFVAVAREGSVTAAAEVLHYAQPSVSHHLAKLEAQVGVPLLQRMGRGIRLTEAGRLLAERGEKILAELEAVSVELQDLAGMRTGHVRLAAFPSALATIVPAAVAKISAEHPGIKLSLSEAEPPEALKLLRNNEVDIALIFEHGEPPQRDRRDISMTRLLDEPLYVVTPSNRRWAGSRNDLATYSDDRWIAGCERCREYLVMACENAGFTPTVDFETDDYVAVQALVAAGLGVGLLPALTLTANRHTEVRLDRVAGLGRQVLAAVYGKPPASRPAQVLLDALAATLAEPVWPE